MAVEPTPAEGVSTYIAQFLRDLRENAASIAFKKPKEEASKQDEEEVKEELLGEM